MISYHLKFVELICSISFDTKFYDLFMLLKKKKYYYFTKEKTFFSVSPVSKRHDPDI